MHSLTCSANSGTGSGYTCVWVGECVRAHVKEFLEMGFAEKGGKQWCRVRAFEGNGFLGERVTVTGEGVKSSIGI